MIIEFDNEDLKNFILNNKANGRQYSKLKSNAQLRLDLNKVIRTLTAAQNCSSLSNYQSLHYEQLKYGLSGFSSVRIGYTSKYRLIFTEHENGIKIILIEISEHYGDK